MNTTDEKGYLPALRFPALTRFYDPLIALTVRERRFKRKLIEQAGLEDSMEVIDLACGTGTLTIWAKQSVPGISITGVDADPEMLDQGRDKAEKHGLEIRFDQAFSTALPHKGKSFDRVISSLFFHHLDDDDKRTTLREVMRVLRPGGELHVADWGRPTDAVMAAASRSIRLLDGYPRTRANLAGELPEFFSEAGLVRVRTEDSLRTVSGTLSLYSAVKPA